MAATRTDVPKIDSSELKELTEKLITRLMLGKRL